MSFLLNVVWQVLVTSLLIHTAVAFVNRNSGYLYRFGTENSRGEFPMDVPRFDNSLLNAGAYGVEYIGTESYNTEESPSLMPAHLPLSNVSSTKDFSVLSWNILLPNSQDNWWNHKMYLPKVPMEKRSWEHRHSLMKDKLLQSDADIICIQEANGDTFEKDFEFLTEVGYGFCLHKKYRFRCATFFKLDKFSLEKESHKDRVLVTILRTNENVNTHGRLLNIVNAHLSGGAAPERRVRQIHDAIDQLRKWNSKALLDLKKQENRKRANAQELAKTQSIFDELESAGTIVCGDFNSDGNTGVRRLLVQGQIDSDWREPQYPDIPLTSKTKKLTSTYTDSSELAYGANVCDGDYGDFYEFGFDQGRPATYIVPNLASILLLPIDESNTPVRTEFGKQVAEGLADTLGLTEFCETELDEAFDKIDLDGNNLLDEYEIEQLLELVYTNTCEKSSTDMRYKLKEERAKFYQNFWSCTNRTELSREQVQKKLIALQQELKGGSNGAELVEIRTESDARCMITRFTPILQNALDHVFESFSNDGETLSEEEMSDFLIKSNGLLFRERGGTWRHASKLFGRNTVLDRQDWYSIFARELGEGKWWQVVYDLEVCGADLRSSVKTNEIKYQGWLDYVYFESKRLKCKYVQEALTKTELSQVHNDGDTFPNEWNPSDHLPVASVFSWR